LDLLDRRESGETLDTAGSGVRRGTKVTSGGRGGTGGGAARARPGRTPLVRLAPTGCPCLAAAGTLGSPTHRNITSDAGRVNINIGTVLRQTAAKHIICDRKSANGAESG